MVETNELLVTRSEPGVAVVTLNRPQARNALSLSVLHQLHVAFKTLGADKQVAAIVLAANGPVFSSGHDLKEMTAHRADKDGGHAFFETTMRSCSEMMQAVVHCPRPVIAAVSGVATAAGCQLVASCDLAVAAESATFATPGVNIGLFCSTPMVALSRKVKAKHAMEMLLTGEMIDAATAREFGLVNRVVPPEYLDQVVMKYARTIAAKSPLAVRMGKEAFYRQAEMGLADAYDYTSRVIVENMLAHDAEEGIAAFIEKRDPTWTGE